MLIIRMYSFIREDLSDEPTQMVDLIIGMVLQKELFKEHSKTDNVLVSCELYRIQIFTKTTYLPIILIYISLAPIK